MKAVRFVLVTATAMALAACQKDNSQIKTTSDGETNMSPSGDSANARGHSMVRVVNAIVGGKEIGIKLDDATIFENVKPASVTDYREVDAKLAKFTVLPTGAMDAPQPPERDQVMMDGNRYTVVLLAEDVSKTVLRVVQDEVIPDSAMARVRILHAAPGGPELDVKAVGAADKLFSGVDFKSEAGYKDVTPATMTLEIRAKDQDKVLLTVPKLELARGTSTTIVVTGAGKLAYFTFVDAMMAPMPKP